MAVKPSDSVGPLHRAHIREGSQLPGGSSTDFRLDWAHTFGTMRIKVKAGVVYVDGHPVVPALDTSARPNADTP